MNVVNGSSNNSGYEQTKLGFKVESKLQALSLFNLFIEFEMHRLNMYVVTNVILQHVCVVVIGNYKKSVCVAM